MNSNPGLEQHLVDSNGYGACRGRRLTGWKAQFACPTGTIGRLVGSLMAFKNEGMNRFAVEMLEPQPEDQTLEIGFGHGRTIGMIAAASPKGHVAGIDISDVMVRQAAEWNRELIKSERVELSNASVTDIPYEYGRFTRVLAVNNFQFWPNPEHNLHEIQRVLRTDGRLVLCLRLNDPAKTIRLAPGFTEEQVGEIAGLVRWTGFRDVRIVRQKAGYYAACIIARR